MQPHRLSRLASGSTNRLQSLCAARRLCLPPAPAKAPRPAVGTVIRVVLIAANLARLILQRSLVASQVGRLTGSLGVVTAADGFIEASAVARDVLLQFFDAIVAVSTVVLVSVVSPVFLILIGLPIIAPVLGGRS